MSTIFLIMDLVSRWYTQLKAYCGELNQSTLSGASDIIVIRDKETRKILRSTPFFVRFGSLGILRPKNHIVDVAINGVQADINLYVGQSGIAYFASDDANVDDNNQDIDNNSNNHIDNSYYTARSQNSLLSNENLNPAPQQQSFDAKSKISRVRSLINWIKRKQFNIVYNEMNQNFNIDREIFDLMLLQNQCNIHSVNDVDYKDESSEGKTLHPSAHVLESLNLNPGCNHISFKVSTAFQGKKQIFSKIYLWENTDKIVVSDIDGTVTRSNLLGHLFSFIGKNWMHRNVSKLYTRIEENGYRIVYLSMRFLAYYSLTKKQLSSIKTDNITLPEGPLLLCPLKTFNSMKLESLLNGSNIIKVGLLRDLVCGKQIQVHCGFGNTEHDKSAYISVGIEPERIFIINKHGEIQQHSNPDSSLLSYQDLINEIDTIFPQIICET